jgi:histone H3/H4
MNHREAWCIEKKAPTSASDVSDASKGSSSGTSGSNEILVVVSKLKDYVKEESGLSVANDALDAISHLLRRECDDAIQKADKDGRKTVKGRDFKDWRILTKRRAAASSNTIIRRKKAD